MKQKILYLMHVPWGWIKQRPHFLAEGLGEYYDVLVCYTKVYIKRLLVPNPVPKSIEVRALPMLRGAHYEPIKTFNAWRLSRLLKKLIHDRQFDVIWLSHPDLYLLIPADLNPNIRVIYDCMDDYLEFPPIKLDKQRHDQLRFIEEAMMSRADVVFASSDALRSALHKRYAPNKEILVVNNGFYLDLEHTDLPHKPLIESLKEQGLFIASYIGTISSWLDTRLIMTTLDRFPDIAFVFWGPLEVPLPQHDRIFAFGPIPHSAVYAAMNASDLLVMPFEVNPLIEAVNPVKLYEYIYSTKPVIAVSYLETHKFKDFVYLYNNSDEFLSLINLVKLRNITAKKTTEECKAFILSNTWKCRIEAIIEAIEA